MIRAMRSRSIATACIRSCASMLPEKLEKSFWPDLDRRLLIILWDMLNILIIATICLRWKREIFFLAWNGLIDEIRMIQIGIHKLGNCLKELAIMREARKLYEHAIGCGGLAPHKELGQRHRVARQLRIDQYLQ